MSGRLPQRDQARAPGCGALTVRERRWRRSRPAGWRQRRRASSARGFRQPFGPGLGGCIRSRPWPGAGIGQHCEGQGGTLHCRVISWGRAGQSTGWTAMGAGRRRGPEVPPSTRTNHVGRGPSWPCRPKPSGSLQPGPGALSRPSAHCIGCETTLLSSRAAWPQLTPPLLVRIPHTSDQSGASMSAKRSVTV